MLRLRLPLHLRSLTFVFYSTLLTLAACTATEPGCVDECPSGSYTTGLCAADDVECTTYEMCSEGEVSCSTSCNAAPQPRCPTGTTSIGNTAVGYPALNSRAVSGCGLVVYCAPCETGLVCRSGEVPEYSIQRELSEHYDCDMRQGFVCVPLDECLRCDEFTVEVESCAPETDCSVKLCGEDTIACETPPSCTDIDACEGAMSPVLRSGDGECPEDALHCVAPPCGGEGAFCETVCHPEGRSVESVELCADENCNFVDVGDERIWCAGEPPSCGAVPVCDEGDAMIERDLSCSVGATCYYRAACGQVIQCEG